MSLPKNLLKVTQALFQQISQLSRVITKAVMNWLLRVSLVLGRQSRLGKAGFILPTVTMVILVVVLLTTAIVIRSFERSKNASNYRVNEASLNASTPALDRAKAKLNALFQDPSLPRGTPSDLSIFQGLKNDRYTFGDEVRLRVAYDFGNGVNASDAFSPNNSIDTLATGATRLENDETQTSVWRFPIDTDNNGKFDSFTLYGLFFRNPYNKGNGDPARPRIPLEARTPPMSEGASNKQCEAALGTSASLVGSQGWFKTGDKLKKSFYAYTATVPITNPGQLGLDNNYEPYKGNKSFTALEYQQDRSRIPLSNNAVVYEDDLDIVAGAALRLNGRVVTNSNLLVSNLGYPIRLYQVSSEGSCFYSEENGKIVVGGNVTNSYVGAGASQGSIPVDLFAGQNTAPTIIKNIDDGNRSTSALANSIAYNTGAYAQRIDFLVTAAVNNGSSTTDPQVVRDRFKARTDADNTLDRDQVRKEELEIYFRNRTRRVPFAEVPPGGNGLVLSASNTSPATVGNVQGLGTDSLRPPDTWIYPKDGDTGVTLTLAQLEATEPVKQGTLGKEQLLGDRVLAGNNLPALWYDTSSATFANINTPYPVGANAKWTDPNTVDRTRSALVKQLADLGVTDRDGFWEQQAAAQPVNKLDGWGGLRVVTGAGVYLPINSTSGKPTNPAKTSGVVWSDTMPVMPVNPVSLLNTTPNDLNNNQRPYLQMRATAVYHYAHQTGKNPIACVSSFYDPTDTNSARNISAVDDVSGLLSNLPAAAPPARDPALNPSPYKSNNGITYGPPADYASYQAQLTYQASLVYPTGRRVNPLLKAAVDQQTLGKPLTLAEQAAVDSTICALQILDNTIGAPTPTPTAGFSLPHGTIQEVSFLDGRQIKAVNGTFNAGTKTTDYRLTTNYNLAIEQRQPLEIRATVLDLDKLRKAAAITIPTVPDLAPEYMLPNSGIIYATRDDALPDATDPNYSASNPKDDPRKLGANVSASDSLLDPTRRPNAIMAIGGSKLARNDANAFRDVEKGLTLASNLPVYIKGQFNLHDFEEFKSGNTLSSNWSNFYGRPSNQLDDNFACRTGDTRLPTGKCATGDQWRAANILSDAVNLVSNNFRLGFRTDGDYDLRNNQIDNDFRDRANPVATDLIKTDGTQLADGIIRDPEQPNVAAPGNPSGVGKIDTPAEVEQKRLQNGFWNNNFVTTRNFTDTDFSASAATSTPAKYSSYFNNFVTPVQRRGDFPEYVMEICRKLPVEACTPGDWVVGVDANSNSKFNPGENQPASAVTVGTSVARLLSSTTAGPALDPADQRYPRRVAFLRNAGNLSLDGPKNTPTVLGIDNTGNVALYPISGGATLPRQRPNALWFTTTNTTAPIDPTLPGNVNYGKTKPLAYLTALTGTTAGEQPLLIPVLQIQVAQNSGGIPDSEINFGTISNGSPNVLQTQWLPQAFNDPSNTGTTFNMVMATGDNPSRPPVAGADADFNGGLPNLPHLLENWNSNLSAQTPRIPLRIKGSLIQLKRSAYATAPFAPVNNAIPTANSPLGYPQQYKSGNNGGKVPSYEVPERQWGFDVGLLSQLPDLFSQRFTLDPTNPPNEYFREVNKDDEWVKTLLCAKTAADTTKSAINDDQRPAQFCTAKTGG